MTRDAGSSGGRYTDADVGRELARAFLEPDVLRSFAASATKFVPELDPARVREELLCFACCATLQAVLGPSRSSSCFPGQKEQVAAAFLAALEQRVLPPQRVAGLRAEYEQYVKALFERNPLGLPGAGLGKCLATKVHGADSDDVRLSALAVPLWTNTAASMGALLRSLEPELVPRVPPQP